jgi:hypothetical protein
MGKKKTWYTKRIEAIYRKKGATVARDDFAPVWEELLAEMAERGLRRTAKMLRDGARPGWMFTTEIMVKVRRGFCGGYVAENRQVLSDVISDVVGQPIRLDLAAFEEIEDRAAKLNKT